MYPLMMTRLVHTGPLMFINVRCKHTCEKAEVSAIDHIKWAQLSLRKAFVLTRHVIHYKWRPLVCSWEKLYLSVILSTGKVAVKVQGQIGCHSDKSAVWLTGLKVFVLRFLTLLCYLYSWWQCGHAWSLELVLTHLFGLISLQLNVWLNFSFLCFVLRLQVAW